MPVPSSLELCQRGGLLEGEARVLEMIARGAPRNDSLSVLARLIEQDAPGVLCCICIFDATGHEIEEVVAPGFPEDVLRPVHGLSLTPPFLMPCAEVSHSGLPNLVSNLETDERWCGSFWAKSLVAHGFRQCRSTPVFHSSGRVCGTFVLLSRLPDQKTLTDGSLSETAAHLAGIAIMRDLDEQLQAENEQRLRLAVEGAGLGIFEWNLKSNRFSFSEHLRFLLNLRVDSSTGLDALIRSVHREDRDRIRRVLDDAVRHGGAFDLEFRTNGDRWLAAKGRSFSARVGPVQHVRGVVADVTSRKHAEQELAEAGRTLQLAVQATQMGLWDWDPKTQTGKLDARCQEIFGWHPHTYEDWMKCIHPSDRAVAVRIFEQALEPGSPGSFSNEYRILRPDGETRWLAGFGSVVFDRNGPEGRAIRVIGANLDITRQKENEKAAEESAARFRFLAESLPHKIFTSEPSGSTSYLNAQWAVYTGLPVDEILRLGWHQFIHPDDLSVTLALWQKALAVGRAFETEHRFRRADGSHRWHLSRAEPLRTDAGAISMWIGSNTDIHDLKQAQLAVQEREERFRSMADATPVLIWMTDHTKGCIYLNRSWLEFTGRRLEEEAGHGWLEGVHPADRHRCGIVYFRSMESQEPFQMEFRLRRRDGVYRWLLDRGEPLRAQDGTFAGFIGGCVDIHDQKELEVRLREAEGRSRLAVEAAGMGFWDWSVGGVIKWSPEHNRILGIPPQTAEGTLGDFLDRVQPADRPRVREAFQKTLTDRVDFEVEFRTCSLEGDVRWVAGHGRAFFDQDTGEPRRMLGVVRDVTDRRNSEERIRQNQEDLRRALSEAETARRLAEEASCAKDQFLAILSHELRTPLTPVLMAVSTFKNDPALPGNVRSALEMIQRNVEMEARLIDDLLDITRISRNRLEFKMEPMDLAVAARQALEICRPELERKSLRLESNLATFSCPVVGDFARLQQVFWNLIKNAIKFTADGGLLRIEASKAEGRVRVAVSDTGVGIDPAILPVIFKPFEQGDAALVRKFGGLGLGLAISQAAVEAHDGRLTAESPGVGCGATFTVELSCGSGESLELETRRK